jgi:hypothetical protein
MTPAEIGLFAVVAYALAFMCQVAYSRKILWRGFLLLTTGCAIACHAIQLHQLIDLAQGQNLSWVNLLSLLTWLAALLIFLADFILPVASLNLFLYPASIITISFSIVLRPHNIMVTDHHPKMLLHILFASVLVALLIICAIQSLLLVLQKCSLKQKKMLSLLELLPPLQSMERLLFFDIALSFVVLSIFLIFSAIDFSLLQNFWDEGVLSLLLWLIFFIVLVGRYYYHWRSLIAAILTCFGVSIALLIYLTNHLSRFL